MGEESECRMQSAELRTIFSLRKFPIDLLYYLRINILNLIEEDRQGRFSTTTLHSALIRSPINHNLRDQYNLYFNLKLSAIIAINSELVGFPRLFWIV